MANPEHVERLVNSTAEQWNAWRENEDVVPDLSGLHFVRAFLGKDARPSGGSVDLRGFNLRDADLTSADMSGTMIGFPDFEGADTRCTWFGSGHAGTPGASSQYSDSTICAGLCQATFEPDPEWLDRLLQGRMRWNRWRAENPQDIPELSGVRIAEGFQAAGLSPKGELVDLSRFDLRDARMRGADFRITKLDSADLSGADLRCSVFQVSEGARVNFQSTDLRRCNMMICKFISSDLNYAKTQSVSVSNVNFRRSKLTGLDFSYSKLAACEFTDARVWQTTFDNTDLHSTTFVRTEFNESELWKGKVFSNIEDEIGEIFPTGATIGIRDVQGLLTRLGDIGCNLAENGLALGHRLYFRGLPNADFDLNSSLMRDWGLCHAEDLMMNELMIRRPNELREGGPFFSKLVMSRHFELPTRLLDITRDPLVALYYAVSKMEDEADGIVHLFIVPDEMVFPYDSDTVSVMANFTRLAPDEKETLLTRIPFPDVLPRRGKVISKTERSARARNRLNHFIAQEKPYWDDRIDVRDFFRVLVVEPQRTFDRLKAHEGAFMLSAFHDRFERVEVDELIEGSAPFGHQHIVIRSDAKGMIKSQLRSLGVTEEALKADLQSEAEAIAGQYKTGIEPPRTRM